MSPPWRGRPGRPLAVLAALLAATPAGAEAGFTFESAEKLWGVETLRPEDVAVPPVVVDESWQKPRGVGDGPELEVKSYEVVGATLIPPAEVRQILKPYLGPGRYMSDVQAAREALQQAYEERGFPTAAVLLPQQTLLDGRVRLEVVEARLGAVVIDNPGIDWYSDAGVRRATPHLQPGALVRTEDLEEDVGRANLPDRRVTPVLKAGQASGTVDLDLKVDDRPPVHGSLEWNNYRTPGTPRQRMTARLGYDNLWQRQHQVAVQYTFVPTPREDFKDVQVWVVTYAAPNPWREGDDLFAYAAWSDTNSVLPTNTAIGSLGNGFTSGARYSFALPGLPYVEWDWYSQALVAGVDYKSIENALVQGINTIRTPIRYLPWSLAYRGTVVRPHAFAILNAGADFNVAGTIDSGGSKEDFQNNRGGIRDDNVVDGTYAIARADFDTTIRLPAMLRTLAQGRFIELPPPTLSFEDDASLVLGVSGQYANEPLVSVEQFPLGGRYSVRGYLEGERFGDHGWDLQVELRTPAWRGFAGGYLGEKIQGLLFYDVGEFFLLDTLPNEGILAEGRLQGVGIGARASFLETRYGSVRGEAFLALPTIATENTTRTPRLQFQVQAEF